MLCASCKTLTQPVQPPPRPDTIYTRSDSSSTIPSVYSDDTTATTPLALSPTEELIKSQALIDEMEIEETDENMDTPVSHFQFQTFLESTDSMNFNPTDEHDPVTSFLYDSPDNDPTGTTPQPIISRRLGGTKRSNLVTDINPPPLGDPDSQTLPLLGVLSQADIEAARTIVAQSCSLERKQRRREQNRRAQQQYRARREAVLQSLQQKIQHQRSEISSLAELNRVLASHLHNLNGPSTAGGGAASSSASSSSSSSSASSVTIQQQQLQQQQHSPSPAQNQAKQVVSGKRSTKTTPAGGTGGGGRGSRRSSVN